MMQPTHPSGVAGGWAGFQPLREQVAAAGVSLSGLTECFIMAQQVCIPAVRVLLLTCAVAGVLVCMCVCGFLQVVSWQLVWVFSERALCCMVFQCLHTVLVFFGNYASLLTAFGGSKALLANSFQVVCCYLAITHGARALPAPFQHPLRAVPCATVGPQQDAR